MTQPTVLEVVSSRGSASSGQFPSRSTDDPSWLTLPYNVRCIHEPTKSCVVLTVTPGTTWVESWAFDDVACIHTVILPASVRGIGEAAFAGCKGLVEIKFAEGGGLYKIGANAFSRCEALRHVSIPEGTTEIHEGAFSNCTNLRTVELPATLTSPLGSLEDRRGYSGGAFGGCTLLRTVTVNNGGGTALPAVLGSPYTGAITGRRHNDGRRANFYECRDAVVLSQISVRSLSGEYFLAGIQFAAWPEAARQVSRDYRGSNGSYHDGDPNTPAAPTPDLNAVLSAQHPETELADPGSYELMAAAAGSVVADVPLSPSIRGLAGAAGLRRLFQGELDFDNIVAIFLPSEVAAAARVGGGRSPYPTKPPPSLPELDPDDGPLIEEKIFDIPMGIEAGGFSHAVHTLLRGRQLLGSEMVAKFPLCPRDHPLRHDTVGAHLDFGSRHGCDECSATMPSGTRRYFCRSSKWLQWHCDYKLCEVRIPTQRHPPRHSFWLPPIPQCGNYIGPFECYCCTWLIVSGLHTLH